MSYTMTMDMPQLEAAYLERHSAQLIQELNAIAIAIVRSRMQQDANCSQANLDFVTDWGQFKIQDGELNLSRTDTPLREVDYRFCQPKQIKKRSKQKNEKITDYGGNRERGNRSAGGAVVYSILSRL